MCFGLKNGLELMCSNPLISLNEVSLWDSNFVLWLVGGRSASWFACAWSELIIFIVYSCTTKSTLSFSLSSEVHLKPNSFPRISTSVKYICSKMPRQTLSFFFFKYVHCVFLLIKGAVPEDPAAPSVTEPGTVLRWLAAQRQPNRQCQHWFPGTWVALHPLI